MRTFLFATTALTMGLVCSSPADAAIVSSFEELPLAPDSHYLPGLSTEFTSGAASFRHEYTEFFPGCCWSGWTYSNGRDTTTPGFTNDTSAIAGAGVDGSANYGVAFLGDARIGFAAPTSLLGAWVTNTTYTYLAVKDGNDGNQPPFVKGPFGEGDFLTLTIRGHDANDAPTGAVDVALAEGANVVDTWIWVDLSSLGAVSALSFAMSSSDTGPFGANTPTYFALDNLTAVPVPAAAWLFASALGVLAGRRPGKALS